MTTRPTASTPNRLGPWRWCAALGLVGLAVLVATGHIVIGAGITASAFVLAAALRWGLPTEASGGLHVRSRALDVVLALAAAVNVFGAALMVGRHLPWQILGAVDLALLLVISTVLVVDARTARARHRALRRRPGDPPIR